MTPVDSPALEARVRDALTGVLDPEIRRPITDLGMVRSVDVSDDGRVAVGVDLTVAGCPMKSTLVRDVTAAATAVEGVAAVDVELGVMTAEQRSSLRSMLRGGAG